MEIRIENLTKIYKGGTKAISDINLVIEDGMFGLLGPNGAGKSTLMRILVTLMKPSSGKVLVNGMDLQKNRKQVRTLLGYLPQDFRFFAKYSFENSLGKFKNMRINIWLPARVAISSGNFSPG